MKANELRIGNWVKQHDVTVYTSNILKPELIGQRIIEPKFNYCQIEYWHLEEMHPGKFSYYEYIPIPLTPEILEKCGFDDERFSSQTTRYDFESLTIYMKTETGEITNTHYYGECILADCKYLHQLQNLYFALTGKELNIEL